MAAVDATDVVAWTLAGAPHFPRDMADAAFAALFARAGIEGAGTIALTRDAEGRYGLGSLDWVTKVRQRQDRGRIEAMQPSEMWMDGEWVARLVPVEDDEEGRDDG